MTDQAAPSQPGEQETSYHPDTSTSRRLTAALEALAAAAKLLRGYADLRRLTIERSEPRGSRVLREAVRKGAISWHLAGGPPYVAAGSGGPG